MDFTPEMEAAIQAGDLEGYKLLRAEENEAKRKRTGKRFGEYMGMDESQPGLVIINPERPDMPDAARPRCPHCGTQKHADSRVNGKVYRFLFCPDNCCKERQKDILAARSKR